WAGETDINSCSIGIEIQNTGHSHGYVPFPDAQIDAVRRLCAELMARHGILPRHVLAHSDIAPLRKIHPGPLSPSRALAPSGIGLWPAKDAPPVAEADVIDALARFGYDPGIEPARLVSAFQRHFEPEAFDPEDASGQITPRTLARIGG